MNVKLMENVELMKCVKILNVHHLVPNVDKELSAFEQQIIVLFVNVLRDTSVAHIRNVDPNVTVMLIVHRIGQLVSMEFVKIHAMEPVELELIVIYVV